MLSNNKAVWSVQVKNATFFRKMTLQEIKDDYDDTIDEYEKKIQALTTLAKKLKAENDQLKKKIKWSKSFYNLCEKNGFKLLFAVVLKKTCEQNRISDNLIM